MKKYFLPMAIILVIITFFLGFIDMDKGNTSKSESEQTFSYGVDKISGELKSVTNLSKRDEDIICAVSKGLVSKDINNKILPSLSSEVTESNDGIQYEFKIEDDIFWSDGSKITPNDIVVFLKELLKEEDEENIEALLDVYGAREFKEGKVTFETGVAIKGTENSIIIRLNKKNDNFLSELSQPQYRLRKYLIMWENMKNNYDKLVYSGDYKIDYIDDSSMTLKRNNKASEGIMDNIKIVKDDNVELSMASFEVKQRDIVIDPPESELNKLSSEGKLVTIPKKDATYLSINNKDNLISLQGRREIYRDICKAIEDYQTTNDKEFELAEGSYFREDKDDLTKLQARKVSSNKESEWVKPDILTLLCNDNSENRILCRSIENWFKKNSDITIKYSLVKEDEFNDQELQKRYDMVLVNNYADKLNKQSFYSNFKEYLTEPQTKIFESLNSEDISIYSALEENMFGNYNILPLIFYNENIALSNKISTLGMDGNGNIDFTTIK